MDIVIIGIDLGKNSCSLAGTHPAGPQVGSCPGCGGFCRKFCVWTMGSSSHCVILD